MEDETITNETTPFIEETRKVREKMDIENRQKEFDLDMMEKDRLNNLLGGETEWSPTSPKIKEETPLEYKNRIVKENK